MGRATGGTTALALPGGRRGGRPREWTPERIAAELTEVLAGFDGLPTQSELRAAGHGRLADAIGRYGGVEAWARRLGRPLRREQRVVTYGEPYTDERAVEDARHLIERHGRLPGSTKLRQLGHPRLAAAVIRAGGAAAFCQRHGLG